MHITKACSTLLLIFLTATKPVDAQEKDAYVFKVIALKGNNKVNGRQLHTGQSLYLNDTIVTDSIYYIGLIDGSGRPFELNIPGRFSVKAILEDRYNRVVPYFDPNLRIKPKVLEKKDYLTQFNFVDPLSPVQFSEFTIFWCADKDDLKDETFTVEISNLFEEMLTTLTTRNNFLVIDLADSIFSSENTIVIGVSIPSRSKSFKPTLLKRKLPADPQLIQNLSSSSKDPIFWYKLGDQCRAQDLELNAMHAYFKAYRLSGNKAFMQKIVDNWTNKYITQNFLTCFE